MVPPPVPPVPDPLVVAAGAAGVVVVVVDVMAIVADPIVFCSCFVRGIGLLWLGFAVVGVMSGAQGSQSSQCVLPGPLTSIVAGVFWILMSSSLSSSVAESLAAGSSGWLSSVTLVTCTSVLMGPRNGL